MLSYRNYLRARIIDTLHVMCSIFDRSGNSVKVRISPTLPSIPCQSGLFILRTYCLGGSKNHPPGFPISRYAQPFSQGRTPLSGRFGERQRCSVPVTSVNEDQIDLLYTSCIVTSRKSTSLMTGHQSNLSSGSRLLQWASCIS